MNNDKKITDQNEKSSEVTGDNSPKLATDVANQQPQVGSVKWLASEMNAKGTRLKTVSPAFPDKDRIEKFINTMFVISSIDRRDETITLGKSSFSLDEFKVDDILCPAFLQPCEVLISIDKRAVNIRESLVYDGSNIMTYPELHEFIDEVYGKFRKEAKCVSVRNYISACQLGDITDVSNGTSYHLEDFDSIMRIPIRIPALDTAYKSSYYDQDMAESLQNMILNIFAAIKSSNKITKA